MLVKSSALLPCNHTRGSVVRCRCASRNALLSSFATTMCSGPAISMQCASEAPDRFVLSNATIPPTRVIPSQIAMYSGRFGISRQTTSPFASSCPKAQRA